MNKMQMAHEYALEMLKETLPTGSLYGDDANRVAMSMVESSWALADAMQAEADKRNKAEAEQKRKEVREILNDANTFIEREGQHFDDVEEWQPDWSQAPEGYNWWAADQCGCYWYDREPKWMDNEWGGYTINKNNRSVAKQISSLGYIGNWKNSLRKRPDVLCEVDWCVAPEWAVEWNMSDGTAHWLSKKGCKSALAPSFGFTGNHIVERPQ